jgi:hypothetical protein
MSDNRLLVLSGSMSDVWVTLASVCLAGAFAWAGSMKVIRAERWRMDLVSYRMSRALRVAVFLVLPWVELGIAGALITGAARVAAVLAIGLLGVFCAAIVRTRLLLGTNELGCGCFGGARILDYRLMLARNVGLATLAALIVASGGGSSAARGLELGGPGALLALLSALAVVAIAWVLWQASQRMHRHDHA